MDNAAGYNEDAEQTKVGTMYSELLLELHSKGSKRKMDSKPGKSLLKRWVVKIKDTMACLLKDNC